MRMGLPRVVLSDNGSVLCNKLNDKLAEILEVKRRLTTPYNPQVGYTTRHETLIKLFTGKWSG